MYNNSQPQQGFHYVNAPYGGLPEATRSAGGDSLGQKVMLEKANMAIDSNR
jgi:hypothetical protein